MLGTRFGLLNPFLFAKILLNYTYSATVLTAIQYLQRYSTTILTALQYSDATVLTALQYSDASSLAAGEDKL